MSRAQWTAERSDEPGADRPSSIWAGRLLACAAILLVAAGMAAVSLRLLKGVGEEPETVVQRYLAAGGKGDREAMAACLTRAGRAAVERSAELLPGDLDGNLADGSLGTATREAGRALVPVKVPQADPADAVCGLTERWYPFVLVEERGAWRIDLDATGRVMMDGLVPGHRREPR